MSTTQHWLDRLIHHIMRLLFRSFEQRESFLAQVDELRKRYPGRPIAFAVDNGGVLEFLALRYFFQERFGPEFELRMATRIRGIWVLPVQDILRRVAASLHLADKPPSRLLLCSQELEKGHPIMLGMRDTRGRNAFETPHAEDEIAYLAEQHPNMIFAPTVIVWRRSRRAEALFYPSGEDILSRFGKWFLRPMRIVSQLILGSPYNPTGIRKTFIMLRQYARSTAMLLEGLEATSDSPAVLRRKILRMASKERQTVLGPAYRSSRLLRENILRDEGFRKFLQTLALERDFDVKALLKRSADVLDEIAADYSYFTIETLAWLLEGVFSRMFEEITVEEGEFERLRAAAREGPILFVPCHKSYLDFLLISTVLFRKGVLPPHIASGINLDFWPTGSLLRGGGAFFIRRSFRGNLLYAEILKRYVASLLSSRFNVEFFIEGGRSRNGKLAPPKYGMLSMLMDAYSQGLVSEKVSIVPVSISYDRVTEEQAHKRELEGGEKVRENMGSMLRGSGKILFRKYGKVHVRFADAIHFNQEADLKMPQIQGPGGAPAKRLFLNKLAFEICHRINKVTPLTGTGVVCALLLAKNDAAMSAAELDGWLARVGQDLHRMHVLLAPDLRENFMRSCHRALARLLKEGVVAKSFAHGAVQLSVPRKQRIAAFYYKNSAIHALLTPALKGLSGGSLPEALELKQLLQFEFFFPEKEQLAQQLAAVPEGTLNSLYACLLDDVLQTIMVGARGLIEMKSLLQDGKSWSLRLLEFGQRQLKSEAWLRPEAVNTQGFNAFIEMAKVRGWLKTSPTQKELLGPAQLDDLQAALNKLDRFRARLPRWENLKNTLLR